MGKTIKDRQYERVPTNMMVSVVYDGEETETLLKNISLGGALIRWDAFLENLDQLTIHFSNSLDFVATVRWCMETEESFDVGVQFEDLDEIAALYFGEYLQTLMSQD